MAADGIPGSPVIVLGMHRSGTSLLARLLATAGVFMGRDLTGNFESRFFQWFNRDILDPFGCSWSHLEELPDASELAQKFQTIKKGLREHLEKNLENEHFGSTADDRRRLWGWKDPRTCLTLPFLHGFFPDARIAFICREPRDVALSLIVRDERRYGEGFRFDEGNARKRFLRYLALWDEYNRRTVEGVRPFTAVAATRYEDFVREPQRRMEEILRVLRVEPTKELAMKLGEVRSDRVAACDRAEGQRFRGLTPDSELFRSWYGERRLEPVFGAGSETTPVS